MNTVPSPITVSYSDDQRILICHETRLLTHTEVDQLLHAVPILTRPADITSVLIDARAQQKPFTHTDAYNYGIIFAQSRLFHIKFAIVVIAAMECRTFLEIVAWSRGVRVRYFTNEQHAYDWLLA
jgi:hypothetical protein